MTITVADILDYARAIISDPDDWCKDHFCAREDRNGMLVVCDYPEATVFSLDGAITRARIDLAPGRDGEFMAAFHALDHAALDMFPNIGLKHTGYNGLRTYINRVLGWKAVMMLLDIACARARRYENMVFAAEQEIRMERALQDAILNECIDPAFGILEAAGDEDTEQPVAAAEFHIPHVEENDVQVNDTQENEQ